MYPAWSSNFMVPRFGSEEGRAVLNAHRPIWSHPQRVESLSDFLRENPEHRHRNRELTDELTPYERVFLSPGLPGGRAEEARAFSNLFSRSGGLGIQAEFVSINEDENGVTTDGYEDSIAGAFREATGRDPFELPNGDPQWVQFRADRWTDMVRAIRDAVKAVRADAVFTITVINRERGRLRPADPGLAGLGGAGALRRDAPLVPVHHRPPDHRTALPPLRGHGGRAPAGRGRVLVLPPGELAGRGDDDGGRPHRAR